jgi:hypothetical protein
MRDNYSRRVIAKITDCYLPLAAFVLLMAVGSATFAEDCPEEPPLQNYTGTGSIVCPCFVPGEEAGAILDAPSEHYPIEILRVGIGWGSMYGGTGQTLEQAIHIYDSGLPNPGTPIFTLEGPVLTDGYINEFNLEPPPGEIIIDSGPFTVTLEFLSDHTGNPYAPSMVHDGNGCQSGKNVVYAIPGGWIDACLLGVTGDWVVYAIYRQVNCGAGVAGGFAALSDPAVLVRPQPNPFTSQTRFDFILADPGHVDLAVYDVRGHRVTTLADGVFASGRHTALWSGVDSDGAPAASGIYFAMIKFGDYRSTQRVVLSK